MTSKEYLMQIRNIDIQIRIISDEIEEIRALLGVQGLSFDKVGSNPNINESDKVLSLIMKLTEKEEELLKEFNKLTDLKKAIRLMISQLTSHIEREVLYRRYFEYQKWETIAHKTNYSYRSIMRIHGNALYNFSQIMKDGTKCHI